MISQRTMNGITAILVGCVLNFTGDRLLGIDTEIFRGLATFSFLWFVDIFVLTFFVGLSVSIIFRHGGKWLCYFPPLIVRFFNYYLFYSGAREIPHGEHLMPMGWWGFFVILAVEAAVFGGTLGEVMIRSTYGRRPKHLVYKSKEPVADAVNDK